MSRTAFQEELRGLSPSTPTEDVSRLFFMACDYSELDTMRRLYAERPDLDPNYIGSEEGPWTPLHLACVVDAPDMVAFLLSIPRIDVNLRDATGDTAVMIATEWGHWGCLVHLLRDPRVDVTDCLWMACDKPSSLSLDMLIGSGKQLDVHRRCHGQTIFEYLAQRERAKVAITLKLYEEDPEETTERLRPALFNQNFVHSLPYE
jgi:hypothetical protein